MSLKMVGVKQMSAHKCAATVGPETIGNLPKGHRATEERRRIQAWLDKRAKNCMGKVKVTINK